MRTYSGVTDLKCEEIDVNNDGRKDCIATGRMGTVLAICIKNGKYL